MENQSFMPVMTLNVVMTKQEEQQVAQFLVGQLQGTAQDYERSPEEVPCPLDRLAVAKHLCNIADLAAKMLTNDALNQVTALINEKATDEVTGEPIQMSKQFTFNGNKWLYQIKETYGQLGNQRLSDGTLDPNSQTYRTLEADYTQTKDHMKALTAQMNGLQARILDDHNLQPTDVVVVLQLKEAK